MTKIFRASLRATLACLFLLCFGPASFAQEVRIVSWNANPTLYEALEGRLDDFRRLAKELNPDVLVLIEVAGEHEVRRIASALGWPEYYAVVTNWSALATDVHFALEAAVISKSIICSASCERPAIRRSALSAGM